MNTTLNLDTTPPSEVTQRTAPSVAKPRPSPLLCVDIATGLHVVPWRDPIVERIGFDACGDYVELFWLPILGPTATWMLRRLAVIVVLHPEGCGLDSGAMSRSFGLGSDTRPKSSFTKSLERLVIFGLARVDQGCLGIRTVVPPVTFKNLARLPEHLQSAHALWSETDPSVAYSAAYRPSIDEGRRADLSAWAC